MTYALTPYPTTDLNDAHPEKVKQVMLDFKDFGAQRMFAGRIKTAVTMEDTKLVQEALFKTPGDGGVIVLDGGGSFRSAMLGDLNAELLRKNGWAGIVINGVVRDSARLANIDIGIKALGTTFVRSGKTGIGALDVPVAFGNVYFEPGQCVYCDEDGVLVSQDPLTP
ncbi:ribonuclease E inhibitor RraA [Rhodobacteraceae bacterium RKSG542]|uniref:ribonuclease E activity regulator RraA n=1 Tax=Pseudovibrio flavus TaxID=2529854 RepID=UPI0012BC92D6|nr:ribonuclease E activity regulator RraA [Pseudovibrio flavus]MTI17522.1 ribonuclease E inhibitor RraA [Pseudovibrio flavus]